MSTFPNTIYLLISVRRLETPMELPTCGQRDQSRSAKDTSGYRQFFRNAVAAILDAEIEVTPGTHQPDRQKGNRTFLIPFLPFAALPTKTQREQS